MLRLLTPRCTFPSQVSSFSLLTCKPARWGCQSFPEGLETWTLPYWWRRGTRTRESRQIPLDQTDRIYSAIYLWAGAALPLSLPRQSWKLNIINFSETRRSLFSDGVSFCLRKARWGIRGQLGEKIPFIFILFWETWGRDECDMKEVHSQCQNSQSQKFLQNYEWLKFHQH